MKEKLRHENNTDEESEEQQIETQSCSRFTASRRRRVCAFTQIRHHEEDPESRADVRQRFSADLDSEQLLC